MTKLSTMFFAREVFHALSRGELNYSEIMGQEPTLVGVIAGLHFYEDPEEGDEGPLLVTLPALKLAAITDCWDLPDGEELAERLDCAMVRLPRLTQS